LITIILQACINVFAKAVMCSNSVEIDWSYNWMGYVVRSQYWLLRTTNRSTL